MASKLMLAVCALYLFAAPVSATMLSKAEKKKHHHKHHKHHSEESAQAASASVTVATVQAKGEPAKEEQILGKMKTLEKELAKKEEAVKGVVTKGRIEVNGPLPADFAQRFSSGTSKATGCDSAEV